MVKFLVFTVIGLIALRLYIISLLFTTNYKIMGFEIAML